MGTIKERLESLGLEQIEIGKRVFFTNNQGIYYYYSIGNRYAVVEAGDNEEAKNETMEDIALFECSGKSNEEIENIIFEVVYENLSRAS